MNVVLVADVTGAWWWRVIAPQNGQIVATSHESFDSKSNARRAARRFVAVARAGELVLLDQTTSEGN